MSSRRVDRGERAQARNIHGHSVKRRHPREARGKYRHRLRKAEEPFPRVHGFNETAQSDQVRNVARRLRLSLRFRLATILRETGAGGGATLDMNIRGEMPWLP